MTEQIAQAIYGAPDRPLKIDDFEIPCYVLEDGTRVLVHNGMLMALDMSSGSAGRGEGSRLAKFVRGKGVQPFFSAEIAEKIANPLEFNLPTGQAAYGYEATILPEICESVLKARDEEKLQEQQMHIAKRSETLMRGFARVGIIALVDEVTGYQDVRDRQALEKILEKFLADELLAWAKKFPDEFYRQLFRLRGWQYDPSSVKRPQLVGKLTNDIVYSRLAPGVLEELKNRTPRDEEGHLKFHYHRWFTPDFGNPRLREHLFALITLMKASPNWRHFMRLLNRSLPQNDGTLPMDLGFDDEGMPL